MKSTLLIIVVVAFFLAPQSSISQVARLVHYQGVLKNSEGTPYNGATDIHFKLYPKPVSEKPIWSEIHQNVEISNGNYEVLLGSQNPLKLSFYEYFLEVKAENINSNTTKLMIVGSGYNFRLWFLFAAYTIVWLAIFIYLVSIVRRQKRVSNELKLLARA